MTEYICREAIIDDLEKEIEANNLALDEDVWINKGLRIAIRDIKDIKAANVQPARFARWIDLDNRILCSGCGAGYDDSNEVKQNTYIFCPNCGARMNSDAK
jgi:hypothetical protein